MAADMGLEELQTRLGAFSQQLESIHELLESDPTNAEFLGIARDLVEVIRLTKEMIELKLSSGDAPSERPSQQPATETVAMDPRIEPQFAPGSICEALSKGVWYPAFIESVAASTSGAYSYNVDFLGFHTTATLAEAELRPVPPAPPVSPLAGALPPATAIAIGFQCEAKYYADSCFYACVVTGVTPHGFHVLFSGYGNAEEVPYEYLRPLPPADTITPASGTNTSSTSTTGPLPPLPSTTKAATSTSLKPAPVVVAKPVKIPESLQVQPGDSEAEKERKRKRVRALKSVNRLASLENARNAKQSDWQAFQHKAHKTRKALPGATGVLSRKSASMFAVPDGVGGRVGVVGSGQGMTAYADGRKKLKTTTMTLPTPQ